MFAPTVNAPTQRRRPSSVVLSALIGVGLIAIGLALFRVELTIRTTGQVFSQDEVRLFAPADGVVAVRRVELGQLVKSGDVLIELDDTDLALRAIQLEREIAELESARARQEIVLKQLAVRPATPDVLTASQRKDRLARIASIQATIERSYADGHEQQIISELELRRQEIERLRSEIELLQTDLQAQWREAGLPELEAEQAQIERNRLVTVSALLRRELELVQAFREARRIRAPIDGRVVTLQARYPGMAVTRGGELIKLAPTGGPVLVRAEVPERNVDLLRVGTRALMESKVFESMLEGPVLGVVQRVAPEADRIAAAESPLYEVDIAVENSPYPLVLGSRLDIRLLLGRRSVAEVLLRSARHARRESST